MSAKSRIYITFLPDCFDVPVSQRDQTVLDVALRNGIQIDHACGGNGTCGSCLVQISEGLENLEERNEQEAEIASDRGYKNNERLCCQIKPVNGLKIKLKG
ncbi:MAG: 2Fe-2S iron-sulfur cluster-binding protein [Pseudobdellovibrionaceae bacterium]